MGWQGAGWSVECISPTSIVLVITGDLVKKIGDATGLQLHSFDLQAAEEHAKEVALQVESAGE